MSFLMANKMSTKPRKGGTPKREILYSEAASHAPRAIEILVELMEKGDNDNVRLGAAKTILAKAIPDLKSMELTGANGDAIKIIVSTGTGFVPAPGGSPLEGQSPVQGIGLASES